MCPRRHPFRRLGRFPALSVATVLVLLAGAAPATAEEGPPPPPTDVATAPVTPGPDTGADPTTDPSADGSDDPTSGNVEPTGPGADASTPTVPEDVEEQVEEPLESPGPQGQGDADGSPSSTPQGPADPPSPGGKKPAPSKQTQAAPSRGDGAVSPLAGTEPEVTGIRVEPEDSGVRAGESVTFVVWADGAPGSPATDVTGQATFEFVGGSGQCAGAVCSSERAGIFTVKATYAGFTDLANLNAVPGEAVSLSLTPSTVRLLRHQVRTFQPVLRDAYGNAIYSGVTQTDYEFGDLDCQPMSWLLKCSSPTAGEYLITATLRADPTMTATARVIVEPGNGVVSDFTATVESTQVRAGQPFQVTASGLDTEGESLDVTDQTTFTLTTTDSNAYNEVDGSCTQGQCRIRSAGRYYIDARHGEQGASVLITVLPGEADSLELTPAVAYIGLAQPQWYQVRSLDAFGNEVELDPSQVELSTEEPAICQSTACAALEQPGTYPVRATALGMTATAELTVYPQTVAPLDQVARIAVAQASSWMPDSPVQAGQPATFEVYGFDAQDRPLGTVTDESTLAIEGAGSWTTPSGAQSLACATNTCTATVAGRHTVTATLGELSASTTFRVIADSESVSSGLAPGNAVIHVGERQSYGFGTRDKYGNRNGSMSSPFRMPFLPSQGATCDRDSCWADQPGTYLIGLDMDAVAEHFNQEFGPDNNWRYAAVLTVLPAQVDRIEVTPDHASVAAGEDVTLTATAYDAADNAVGDVTDSTTFHADGSMTCTQNVCRSTVAGTYEIEGTHQALVDSAQVGVTAAAADTDVLTPTDSAIRVGEVVDYTVTRVDEFDNVIGNVTGEYTFTVGPDTACEAARCAPRRPGEHAVTARASGHPDLTARITVSLPDTAYLVLTPGTASVVAGVPAPFTASLHDVEEDRVTDVTAETSFTASDDATCTAAACTSTRVGAYTVTGSYGDLTDDADLTVTPAPVARITVSPDGTTIDAGATQAFSVAGYDTFDNPVGDLTGDASFTITAPGACTAHVCGSAKGGDFTVTASYLVPGPTGPLGRTMRLRAAAAAAPGSTLTASAALTVRSSDDTPGGDGGDGGNSDDGDPDDGNQDDGNQGGDAASGGEGAEDTSTASIQSADDAVLPATGAGVEVWQIGTGLLLLLTGLACLRRMRRRPGTGAGL